jgi:hypothetical protein
LGEGLGVRAKIYESEIYARAKYSISPRRRTLIV